MPSGSKQSNNFWRRVAEHLHTGQPAYLAVVVSHTRHSPGSRGAHLMVRPDGSQVGTVGGGIMEAEIVRRGRKAIATGDHGWRSETLEHKRQTGASANPSGLICAGRQTMLYWVARPSELEVYETYAGYVEADSGATLSVVGGSPSVIEEEPNPDEPPITFFESSDTSEYREHSVNRHRVAIVGGGHCGLALSQTMSQLGYHVTNFEVREDVFTFEQNEWVDNGVVVSDYREAARQVRFPGMTHFVVMTADMMSDVRALEGAAGIDFPYVGIMGSAAKLEAIRESLADRGVDPSGWRNVYAPVGLEMTSNTPPEIAISIAAQILREREKLFPWTRPEPLTG